MKLLTQKQKEWIVTQKIEVDSRYMFPNGFWIYPEPKWSNGEFMDTNPFTKSLSHELFLVKEKVNGLVRGNFYLKPAPHDFYISEQELSFRGFVPIVFLAVIFFIPFVVWNAFRKDAFADDINEDEGHKERMRDIIQKAISNHEEHLEWANGKDGLDNYKEMCKRNLEKYRKELKQYA